MNIVEHFFIGWCIANASPQLGPRQRAIVTAAAVAPDIDGLGMLVELPTRGTTHPLFWWTDYHHVLAHNIGAAIVFTAIAFIAAKSRGQPQGSRMTTAILALVAFHSHILGDVIGARGPDGYQWPIPYFLPFSRTPELVWDGQWALNAWQNFVIIGIAMALTFVIAWSRGHSPLEMISARANAAFVDTLRSRVPRREVG